MKKFALILTLAFYSPQATAQRSLQEQLIALSSLIQASPLANKISICNEPITLSMLTRILRESVILSLEFLDQQDEARNRLILLTGSVIEIISEIASNLMTTDPIDLYPSAISAVRAFTPMETFLAIENIIKVTQVALANLITAGLDEVIIDLQAAGKNKPEVKRSLAGLIEQLNKINVVQNKKLLAKITNDVLSNYQEILEPAFQTYFDTFVNDTVKSLAYDLLPIPKAADVNAILGIIVDNFETKDKISDFFDRLNTEIALIKDIIASLKSMTEKKQLRKPKKPAKVASENFSEFELESSESLAFSSELFYSEPAGPSKLNDNEKKPLQLPIVTTPVNTMNFVESSLDSAQQSIVSHAVAQAASLLNKIHKILPILTKAAQEQLITSLLKLSDKTLDPRLAISIREINENLKNSVPVDELNRVLTMPLNNFLDWLERQLRIIAKLEHAGDEFNDIFFPVCTKSGTLPIVVLNQNELHKRPSKNIVTLENIITIFVHGSRVWPPGSLEASFVPDGLHLATSLKPEYKLRNIALTLSSIDPARFPLDTFYLFGWSGGITPDARFAASQDLYAGIVDLIHNYVNDFSVNPCIQIITHSHGGNVVLYFSLVKDDFLPEEQFKVSSLIILADPVQDMTSGFVADPLFEDIISFFSPRDFYQIYDPQDLFTDLPDKKLFSERIFPDTPNITQVLTRINRGGVSHADFIRLKFLQFLPDILAQILFNRQNLPQPTAVLTAVELII